MGFAFFAIGARSPEEIGGNPDDVEHLQTVFWRAGDLPFDLLALRRIDRQTLINQLGNTRFAPTHRLETPIKCAGGLPQVNDPRTSYELNASDDEREENPQTISDGRRRATTDGR